jgi:hypothetical protein
MREAGMCIAEQRDLNRVFDVLESSFAADDFRRAEIRLRPSFVAAGSVRTAVDRRLDDDVAIWSWNRGDAEDPALWEIKLPLLSGASRIGSMVLWKDGAKNETSLSHMHAIAGELREAVQVKIVELWPDVIVEDRTWRAPSEPMGTGGERVVAIAHAEEFHRRREERTVSDSRVAQPTRPGDLSRHTRAS